MDFTKQGLYSSSGVVLRRSTHGEGNIGIYVFLKGIGPVWVNAPGSARGKVRFGGATEPMTWGIFNIYKGIGSFYLKSVEIKNDSWLLRKDYKSLKIALKWLKLLSHNLLEAHPDDKLLGILYWSFNLLIDGIDPEMVDWRFMWRWLTLWGLAPDLRICSGCGRPISEGFWSSEAFFCSSCLRGDPENAVSARTLRILDKVARLSNVAMVKGSGLSSDVSPGVWAKNAKRFEELLVKSR